MNDKFDKTIYLGLVAQRVLTKQEYKKLTAKATKGYKGNIPLYDNDKLYKILSKEEKLKPYLDKFDEVNELVQNKEFEKALELIFKN